MSRTTAEGVLPPPPFLARIHKTERRGAGHAQQRLDLLRRTATILLLCCGGGPTTRAAAPAPHVLLLDAALAGAEIVAVGERGTILRSPDSGTTWEPVTSPTSATLTGVAFAPDARHGWTVGHDAFIAATDDAGHSWRAQWQGKNLESSFLDVCALDAEHVIAIGAYGLCQTTADGGKSWQPQKILDDDMHLNRISRGPSGTLYIAGERGTLLRSADAGRSWTRIASPYDGSFYGILPLGPRTLLAYGLRGRAFRSTNDGDAWTPVVLDRPMLLSTAVKTKSGTVVLAGQARALFISTNDGETFAPWTAEVTPSVAELLETPAGTLLAFGETGVIHLAQ